jgi:hypothetical protein
MKVFTFMLVVVGVLFLADVSSRIWIWHSEATYRAQFRFENFHTNGAEVFGIEEAKTGRPLLMTFNTADGEKPGEVSYFLQGTNVLDIYLKKGEQPRYRFIFHGLGKCEVWWMNLGGEPSFTERISYDTNGNRSDFEAWYAGAWHLVDRRDNHNGIVIDGQWHQLAFDTNGAWMIDTTNHF